MGLAILYAAAMEHFLLLATFLAPFRVIRRGRHALLNPLGSLLLKLQELLHFLPDVLAVLVPDVMVYEEMLVMEDQPAVELKSFFQDRRS